MNKVRSAASCVVPTMLGAQFVPLIPDDESGAVAPRLGQGPKGSAIFWAGLCHGFV